MRVILDTNVFVSGIFFTGPPYQILKAWYSGSLSVVISEEILAEYQKVGKVLAAEFPTIDLQPILDLVTISAKIVQPQRLSAPVCDDKDDDKFIACALANKSKLIVSGDKHLLKVSGFQGIRVITPRQFVNEYLSGLEKG